MGTIVKPHAASDGAPARPDHVNAMLDIIYNEFNGNIDWDNIKAALQNAANGLVKLDADAKVPIAQIPAAAITDTEYLVPSGIIVMWSGTLGTIPADWSLCDGTGGTPDLRDKFIYGWTDGVDPGGTGGAATHQHDYSDVPSHNHTITPNPHTHSYSDSNIHPNNWGTFVGSYEASRPRQTEALTTGGTSLTIANTGVASPETDAGSTLPPYFKLAFIIKD